MLYFILLLYSLLYLYSVYQYNIINNNMYSSNFSKFYTYLTNILIKKIAKRFIIIHDNEEENILFTLSNNESFLVENNKKYENILFDKIYKSSNFEVLSNYIHSYINNKDLTISLLAPHGAFISYCLFSGSIIKKIANSNGNVFGDSILGYIPLLNTILSLNSGIDIKYLNKILLQKNKNIILYMGGIKEQIFGINDGQLYYSDKLLIFENAIKYGYNLQPIYIFGENKFIERNPPSKLNIYLLDKHRIGIPSIKKINNLEYIAVYGKILITNNSMTKYELFEQYKKEMIRIFNKYKNLYDISLNDVELEFINFNNKSKL